MSYCVQYLAKPGMRAWIESCYPTLDAAKDHARHKAIVNGSTKAVIGESGVIGWFDKHGKWIPAQPE